MGWGYIVIEGHCVGSWDRDGKCPCGQRYPTDFCLLCGHCPHFGYTTSNEREAVWFVPLRLIIWDRIKSISDDVWNKITWHIWNRWFFQKKWKEFMSSIKVGECPAFDKAKQKSEDKFPGWLEKAKREQKRYST